MHAEGSSTRPCDDDRLPPTGRTRATRLGLLSPIHLTPSRELQSTSMKNTASHQASRETHGGRTVLASALSCVSRWVCQVVMVLTGNMLLSSIVDAQQIERVNLGPGGVETSGFPSFEQLESVIAADGNFVAFSSYANNLDPLPPGNGVLDVFRRDLVSSSVDLVSILPTGTSFNVNAVSPTISRDGLRVAFVAQSPNDSGSVAQVWLRLPETNQTFLVSRSLTGASIPGFGSAGSNSSHYPMLSADGRFLVFASRAEDLALTGPAADADSGAFDIFLADLTALPAITLRFITNYPQPIPSASCGGRRPMFTPRDVQQHHRAYDLRGRSLYRFQDGKRPASTRRYTSRFNGDVRRYERNPNLFLCA